MYTQLQWASSTAAVLNAFAGIEIQSLLHDLDVHNPLNAFVASYEPHYLFDQLDMWLTPSKARLSLIDSPRDRQM